MPEIRIAYVPAPIFGTDAEPLWYAGMRDITDNGKNAAGRVTPPDGRWHAWVAYVDGVPAALQLSELRLAEGESEGKLTYVVPSFRGLRLYAAIQARMDADLLDLGITHAVFTMPDTPTSDALETLVLQRGGRKVAERDASLPSGAARMREYRRALRRD